MRICDSSVAIYWRSGVHLWGVSCDKTYDELFLLYRNPSGNWKQKELQRPPHSTKISKRQRVFVRRYCYENVILPLTDVTSPNVMLSPQCLPAFSLVWAGGRNTVVDRDPPPLFTKSSARFDLWVPKQPGTRNSAFFGHPKEAIF